MIKVTMLNFTPTSTFNLLPLVLFVYPSHKISEKLNDYDYIWKVFQRSPI